MEFDKTCWLCDMEFNYDDDDVGVTNDIEGGQYVEYDAINCPHCGSTNRL